MNTADRIIETAEQLIQQRGFHGFSFQDVAERIGIKKASIYYHFPAKAELGRAVIDRYRQRMREVGERIDSGGGIEGGIDPWQALSLYLEPIVAFGRTPDLACLCGVLGGEYLWLPEEMQAEIRDYFAEHQTWLARLLESGRAAGAFRFEPEPDAMAKLLFAAIEGGLLIKRASGDDDHVDGLIDTAALLLGRPAATEA